MLILWLSNQGIKNSSPKVHQLKNLLHLKDFKSLSRLQKSQNVVKYHKREKFKFQKFHMLHVKRKKKGNLISLFPSIYAVRDLKFP